MALVWTEVTALGVGLGVELLPVEVSLPADAGVSNIPTNKQVKSRARSYAVQTTPEFSGYE